MMDDCAFYLSELTDDGVILGRYVNFSKSAGEECVMGFARLKLHIYLGISALKER